MEKTTTKDQVFGYQLLLDLYDCKKGACDDLTLNYQFLDEIVGHLGMEKQAPPNIFRSDEVRFPDKAGLSGWVPLIESSIVVHTLTPKNFITIDIYCCRYFSVEKAIEFCKKFFDPKKIDDQYIVRGTDYFKTDSNYHTLEVKKTAKKEEVVVSKKETVLATR
jgi:S-adenosylmethionine/arginine decarboxylase-like enzyme